MLGTALNAILTVQPGETDRSASGFFGRTEAGETVFLSSAFRLPWHAKHARASSRWRSKPASERTTIRPS